MPKSVWASQSIASTFFQFWRDYKIKGLPAKQQIDGMTFEKKNRIMIHYLFLPYRFWRIWHDDRAWISGEKISKSELDTTFWIFPPFFQHWQSSNSGPAGRMADLPVLKKCGKIQNVVSSFDFEIFSLKKYALIRMMMITLLKNYSKNSNNKMTK